jgi:hypothetical protein
LRLHLPCLDAEDAWPVRASHILAYAAPRSAGQATRETW